MAATDSKPGRKALFTDVASPKLTDTEVRAGLKAVRRAVAEARGSLWLTKRRLYRRYRAEAGDRFLDWDRWEAAYKTEYRGTSGPGGSGATDYSGGGYA